MLVWLVPLLLLCDARHAIGLASWEKANLPPDDVSAEAAWNLQTKDTPWHLGTLPFASVLTFQDRIEASARLVSAICDAKHAIGIASWEKANVPPDGVSAEAVWNLQTEDLIST